MVEMGSIVPSRYLEVVMKLACGKSVPYATTDIHEKMRGDG